MKKILLLIFLLTFSILKVDAKSTWSDWTTEAPTIDNIEIETETRYKWYKEEKNSLGYINPVENVCEYLDEKDFITEKNVTLTFPEIKENRIIKPYSIENTSNPSYLSYVHLLGFTINQVVNITEIEIINNNTNEKLPYNIVNYTYFNEDNIENLYDTNYNDLAVHFENSDAITFELDKFYDIETISIKIYFEKNEKDFSTIRLGTSHNKETLVTLGNLNNIEDLIECNKGICTIEIKINEAVENISHEETKYAYEYTDTLYKCYETKKTYLEGYYPFIENYTLDETTKTVFYRYKELDSEANGTFETEQKERVEITYKELDKKQETNKSEETETKETTETEETETQKDTIALVETKEDSNNTVFNTIILIIFICIILAILTIFIIKLKKYFELRRLK